ncbi:MAG: class I SAM-dependent methyltransferase [Saccharofermentanales bacterium]
MNTIWSNCLQKIGTLYKTRSLRFNDKFKSLFTDAFDMDSKRKILEIGCGPGALSKALHRWYPNAEVIGSDIDTNFVAFTKENSPEIESCIADATALPFNDGSFDVTISNTVQEHIEPSKFFGEQFRVLKEGGICLVLSSRKSINIVSEAISKSSDFENEMYKKTEALFKAADEKYNVCKYPMTEQELPEEMAKYGFKNISTHYVAIKLTPDSDETDETTAIEIIEASRQVNLDSITLLQEIAPDILTKNELSKWAEEINKRYDKRVEQYRNGEKVWDVYVPIIMVVRGVK